MFGTYSLLALLPDMQEVLRDSLISKVVRLAIRLLGVYWRLWHPEKSHFTKLRKWIVEENPFTLSTRRSVGEVGWSNKTKIRISQGENGTIASGLATLHRPTYAKLISTFSQAKNLNNATGAKFYFYICSPLWTVCKLHNSAGKLHLQFLLFTHGLGEV